MTIERIQTLLVELYDLDLQVSVNDFVCDAHRASAWVGETAVARREVLVIHENGDDLELGLYLDPQILEAINTNGGGSPANLDAYCLATEGVSHLLYLMFRAHHANNVSQLELELQAEVDKYACAMLQHPDIDSPQELSRQLRQRLFGEVRFLDAASTEEGQRYRQAHRLAARYTASLERRHLQSGTLLRMIQELRRFYRMGMEQKTATAECGAAA